MTSTRCLSRFLVSCRSSSLFALHLKISRPSTTSKRYYQEDLQDLRTTHSEPFGCCIIKALLHEIPLPSRLQFCRVQHHHRHLSMTEFNPEIVHSPPAMIALGLSQDPMLIRVLARTSSACNACCPVLSVRSSCICPDRRAQSTDYGSAVPRVPDSLDLWEKTSTNLKR